MDTTHIREALSEPGPGKALVVDGGGSLSAALVDSHLAEVASANRWAGVVVYGAVRRMSDAEELRLGIKAAGTSPRIRGLLTAGTRNQPVSFGGARFEPGSFVVSDADGLVLLPSRP